MKESQADLPILDQSTFADGWKEGVAVLADKPVGWSSFQVVRVLRSFSGIKKIGHAGTLDPMASGLLICCIGRSATRLIDTFVGLDKIYRGTLRLGQTTASYDAETPIQESHPFDHVTEEALTATFDQFLGPQLQQPPMYSAVKVEGTRLYHLARKGQTVVRLDRPITIHRFSFVEKNGADVTFEVCCSKGTYIRTLVHDVGQRVASGAHLVALRRTAIGSYSVENAIKPETLRNPSYR